MRYVQVLLRKAGDWKINGLRVGKKLREMNERGSKVRRRKVSHKRGRQRKDREESKMKENNKKKIRIGNCRMRQIIKKEEKGVEVRSIKERRRKVRVRKVI